MNPLLEAHQAHLARLARMGALPPRAVVTLPPRRKPALPVPAVRMHGPLPAALNGRNRQARLLVADIAEAHGLSFRDLIGRARFKEIVAARMEACFQIAKQIPDISLKQIGRIICKDHTTVINAVRVMNERTGENVRGLGIVPNNRKQARLRSARISAGVEERV
jgi:hypothetical protein